MKYCIIFILLFSSTAFAQQETDKTLKLNDYKFSFGWFYSPEVAYRFLSEGANADATTTEIMNYRNENERARFGQSFSFFFGYQFSERFRVELGLISTDYGEALKTKDVVYAGDIETAIGTLKQTNHITVNSIPINLRYTWGGFGKTTLFSSIGISPGMFHKYRTIQQIDYKNGNQEIDINYFQNAQAPFNAFILSAQVSSGLDVKYSRRGTLRIAPVFRITTNSVTKDTPIRGHYFNAGIEVGTVYKL